MSRPTFVFVLVAGFLAGVVGAGLVWAIQNGVVSDNGARGYMAALRLDTPRMTIGLLVFVIFALYWSCAAGDSAGSESTEPGWSTTLHRVLVGVALIAILFPIPGLSARFAPSAGWVVAVGLVVELAGVVLAVLARRALGRSWSSAVRVAPDHQLVRTGVYRRLRHPIYTGMLLVYLGLALQSGRLNALAGFALAVAAYWRKLGLEEQLMKIRFGSEFEAWRKESWALLPPLL
jgi:protein-S-isoprenylcysteine O-methyltransferase Ste14